MRDAGFEEGLDERLTDALRAHAASPPAAPAGFTARVMARARRARAWASPALLVYRDPLPWWVRAAAQPALVLALTLAVIVLRYPAELAEAGSVLVSRTPAWIGTLTVPFQQQDSLVRTALLVSFGTMALLAAVPLYYWSRGLARIRFAPRTMRAAR